MARKKLICFPLLSFLNLIRICDSVVMPVEEEFLDEDPNYGFSYTFQHCLRNEAGHSIGKVLPCFNKGAFAALMEADERDSVEISNGVTLIKDMKDKSQRTIISPHMDRTDYRNVLEATAELTGRRSLTWDMSVIHPGLVMRVGPTINGAGVLEFVMERGYAVHNDRTVGTGQMIVRQILLPLLLGFKLKLITLVPLLIGILVIVSKKALFLSKIAVFVTAVLGLNSLLFLQQPSPTHLQNTFGDSFLEPQTLAHHNKASQLSHGVPLDDFREHVFRERDRIGGMTEPKEGRNFLWEDTEKSHGVSSNSNTPSYAL